jgi:hypothetical protein
MKLVKCFSVALLIFFVSVQAQTTPADIFNFPELDFATPEAAIEHFAESIAKNDLAGALQAFAINEYADNFDFTAQTKRLAAIDMYQSLAPTEYAMYAQLNRLQLLSRYAAQIRFFSYSFHSTETLDGAIISNPTDEQLSTFITSVNPEQLTKLTLAKIIRIVAQPGRYLDTLKEQIKPVGADESTELLLLYELDRQYYFGGAHLLRYGEAWKIDSLNSFLANTPALGTVTPTTPEEFPPMSDSDDWKLEEVTH